MKTLKNTIRNWGMQLFGSPKIPHLDYRTIASLLSADYIAHQRESARIRYNRELLDLPASELIHIVIDEHNYRHSRSKTETVWPAIEKLIDSYSECNVFDMILFDSDFRCAIIINHAEEENIIFVKKL